MNGRWRCLLAAGLCALLLMGCTAGAPGGAGVTGTPTPAATGSADTPGEPDDSVLLHCTVVDIDGGSLLLAGAGVYEGVYRVQAEGIPVFINGEEADASALRSGQALELAFGGAVAESFPMIPGGVTRITVTGERNGLIALYFQVFDDLMRVDPALGSGIEYLGIDLSTVANLTGSEKSAICWRLGERYEAQPVSGTFDELCEQGYIDREQLYWEDGVLLKIELTEAGDDTFKFNAEKWRSGLGAIFYSGCTAVRTPDGWTYEVGTFAIS